MAKPEEFIIHINPDGRVVFDGREMEESSYRRIVELLEATIGPTHTIDTPPAPPPGRHFRPVRRPHSDQAGSMDLNRRKG